MWRATAVTVTMYIRLVPGKKLKNSLTIHVFTLTLFAIHRHSTTPVAFCIHGTVATLILHMLYLRQYVAFAHSLQLHLRDRSCCIYYRFLRLHSGFLLVVPVSIAEAFFLLPERTLHQQSKSLSLRIMRISPISFSATSSILPIYQALLNLAPTNISALTKRSSNDSRTY